MNKVALVNAIQNNLGEPTTKKQAETALQAVVDAIKEGIFEDEKVQIVGFGTFLLKRRSAREGRNPKTGVKMMIPELKLVTFKASELIR